MFNLTELNVLTESQQKEYISKYLVPLTNGKHAIVNETTFDVYENDIFERVFLNRMTDRMRHYYTREFYNVLTLEQLQALYPTTTTTTTTTTPKTKTPKTTTPKPKTKTTAELAETWNSVFEFINETFVKPKKSINEKSPQLWLNYVQYCKDKTQKELSKPTFTKSLQFIELTKNKSNGCQYFKLDYALLLHQFEQHGWLEQVAEPVVESIAEPVVEPVVESIVKKKKVIKKIVKPVVEMTLFQQDEQAIDDLDSIF
jgi:hypothetical protein